MPTFLDDQPVDLSGPDLAHVLSQAQQRAQAVGRVIVEVQVNGEALVGEELQNRGGAPVAGAELRLYTAEPRELALATLEQLGPMLADARVAQAEAADLLRRDEAAEAMKRIAQAMSVWQQSQQAVQSCTTLAGVDLSERTVEGQPIRAFTEALLNQLRGLRDQLAAGDTVALADSLEYEWPEMTDRWERLILELRGWIGEARPG
jgi:hypothetical protein